ncbi:hypothetical protein PGB90_002446 [Kerria lacca]
MKSVLLIFKRNLSSITTSITKIHRNIYSRMYPILLVLPNGATIKIRYPVPQGIIKLPININTLSENEKRLLIDRRKPKQKVLSSETIKTAYNPTKYINLVKKKK